MSDNDNVTICGGIPRFGTTPTTGQAIAGGGNGFVIYDSAEDNTGIVPVSTTPLPNKNMEIAEKTVAGVKSQYYGFAGYCASYYSTAVQPNATFNNVVSFNGTNIEYGIGRLGGPPTTQLTALHPGVYKISGTLDFFLNGLAGANPQRFINVWITKNGTLVNWTYRDFFTVGDYARLVAVIDYMIMLDANDYVEILWYATDILNVLDPNMEMTVAFANSPSALINMNMVR